MSKEKDQISDDKINPFSLLVSNTSLLSTYNETERHKLEADIKENKRWRRIGTILFFTELTLHTLLALIWFFSVTLGAFMDTHPQQSWSASLGIFALLSGIYIGPPLLGIVTIRNRDESQFKLFLCIQFLSLLLFILMGIIPPSSDTVVVVLNLFRVYDFIAAFYQAGCLYVTCKIYRSLSREVEASSF